MNNAAEINIFECLDKIRDNAPALAKARAERVYMEEFRKTQKALSMKAAESRGISAISAQERDAYADPAYQAHLVALMEAVEAEQTLYWKMVAEQAAIEAWRSIEASRRMEAKTL